MRLDRNTVISGFKLTPYTSGEFFYSEVEKEWNEQQYAFGVDFPMRKQMIFNLEAMGQSWHFGARAVQTVAPKSMSA